MSLAISDLRAMHSSMVNENAKLRGARDSVKKMITGAEDRIKDMNARQQSIADGILLVQRFSEGIQTGVVQRFEDLLTKGIRQIFNKEYTISIEFSTQGNTLNADFFVTLPDGKKVNLAKGEGGGMRDLVAVLQRILYIVLEPSRPAKLLLLDENLKALDVGRAPAAFSFIKELCKELEIQVIFVTHQQFAIESDTDGIKLIVIGEQLS